MLLENERIDVVAYGNRMISEHLTSGTAGNISIYDPKSGYMAISPSGIPYADTQPKDIVIMDLEGNIIDGERKPSSEYLLHSVFYKNRKDICAVVHAHSMYCTTLACMGQPLVAVHYAIADTGSSALPIARYETFGTPELAEAVEEVLDDHTKGMLLANHGMLAAGKTIKEAFSLAMTMEWCAELQWRCMCAGKPNILTDKEMEKALEKYKTYGQPSTGTDEVKGYF